MRPFVLADIEAVAQLMDKYELDAYESEHFSLKKSRHKGQKAEATPQEMLEPHLRPDTTHPWDAIPQEALDKWAMGGKP